MKLATDTDTIEEGTVAYRINISYHILKIYRLITYINDYIHDI
jgi:hypothetical protein